MAFKMNRPIIKGTPLQKNTGNNPNDLRRNIGGNTLGLKDRGELNKWYTSNMDKDNFGYNTYEDFKKDWPNAVMQDGYALTFEGGPDYLQKVKPEKVISIPTQQAAILGDQKQSLKKAGIDIDKSKYKYSKYYDSNKQEYRVRVIDKSKKGKANSEVNNVSLDFFKEIYK
tara:strand:- start:464 stop:973 length:510 start_codon:yes stop_codon:yes gene_type:complete